MPEPPVPLPSDPRFGQSHGWLLRLFESEFFNAWMAVYYLFKYAEHKGIQEYLCESLRRFSADNAIEFLPQLCHMLIIRPSMEHLESLLIDLCRDSTHFSLMTLWYFEAYLSDLESHPDTLAFRVCTRVIQMVERIVSARDDDDSHTEVKPPVQDPGKMEGGGKVLARLEIGKRPSSAAKHTPSNVRSVPGRRPGSPSSPCPSSPGVRAMPSTSPSLEDLHRGKAFSFSHFVSRMASVSPFGSNRNSTSSPQSPSPTQIPETAVNGKGSNKLEGHDKSPSSSFDSDYSADPKLLEQYYYHSELQFIASLGGIADRLVPIPKEARQPALTAELTLLNHNFPAPVCIPMWCKATGQIRHHQIVRISPTDAVVLNSADRVPFLLFIEVIEDDEDETSASNVLGIVEKKRAPIRRRSSLSLLSASNSPTAASVELEGGGGMGMRKSPSTSALSDPVSPRPPQSSVTPADNEFENRMRTAAIMLAQLALQDEQLQAVERAEALKKKNAGKKPNGPKPTDEIRNRIIKEMMALEESRVTALREMNALTETTDLSLNTTEDLGEDLASPLPRGTAKSLPRSASRRRQTSMPAPPIRIDKEDPSSAVVQEKWERKKDRIRSSSLFGSHKNWNLLSVIVKSGADLRQEQLACQLIHELGRVWQEAEVGCWVYPYRVLVTGHSHGIIETVRNTISIHSLKKDAYARFGDQFTLKDFFVNEFGPEGSSGFVQAQANFLESLAGYSIMSYILNVKDRHNGNILLDLTTGHLVHIDFGFMLSNSPGSVGFETAPFKFSQEYADLLDGFGSDLFKEWRKRMVNGFLALRRHHERIVGIVEIMEVNSPLDCFSYTSLAGLNGAASPTHASTAGNTPVPQPAGGGAPAGPHALAVSAALRERLLLTLTDSQVADFVDRLIASSMGNVFTRLYDGFQYYTQGVMA